LKNWILFAPLALYLSWASPAQAGCARLLDAVTLATSSFVNQEQPDAETLAALRTLITGLDNTAMLNALRATGQTGDFGDLRNFLTLLNFIAHNVAPGDVQFTPQFMASLASADRIVRSACVLPDGQIRIMKDDTAVAEQSSSTQRTQGIGNKLRAITGLRRDGDDQLLNYNLGVLGLVFTVFLSVGVAALALHFAIIALRIIYRGRRTCDIPATLEVLAQAVPGRLTMIGIYGCIFDFPQDPDNPAALRLTEKTYCRVVAGNATLNARVLKDSNQTCSLWFTKPLARSTLRQILLQSERPVAYDFGILRKAHRRGLTFGLGTLPLQ